MLSPGSSSNSRSPSCSWIRPGQHDHQLLGVAVCVRLVARRAARIELGGEHLEVLERTRREQVLAGEVAKAERRSLLAPQHARIRARGVRFEQVGDLHAERCSDARQRRDARARLSTLDLAQEALAQTRPVGNGLERRATQVADRPQPRADVDLGSRSRGQNTCNRLGCCQRNLKRH